MGPLGRIPRANIFRGARGLHELRSLLPLPPPLPRRVPRDVSGRRGAQRLPAGHPGSHPGGGRRADVRAERRGHRAGGGEPAAAVRHHGVPAAAGGAVGDESGQLHASGPVQRVRVGARRARGRRQGRRGDVGAGGAVERALGARAGAHGDAERAGQRGAAVGAVVLVHAVRQHGVPPGGVAGRAGQPGGVPGGRVAGAAAGPRAGRAAGRRGGPARLHPRHGAAQPRAAAAAPRRRSRFSGDLVDAGVGHGVVRAHVGVRVGAARRRARHARRGRGHAGRLGRGLGRHLPAHQLHPPLHAGARLPGAAAQLGPRGARCQANSGFWTLMTARRCRMYVRAAVSSTR